MVEKIRGEHGWYVSQEAVWAPLLKCGAVKNWSDTLDAKNARKGKLYSLWVLLEDNKLGPEEFLRLPDQEIKQALKHTCLKLQSEKKYAFARRTFYGVRSFLDYNDRWDDRFFKRDEKKAMLNHGSLKKIGRQYVPTKEDVYRMADAAPSLRDKAILLCMFQSGVRGGCLANWKWKMFKDTLFPKLNGEQASPKYPVKVLITADEDSKISKYGVQYYVTFLNIEAGEALREYMIWRKKAKTVRFGSGPFKADGRRTYREETEQWVPEDNDPIFVTEGTVSRGAKLDLAAINEVVKRSGDRVGIDSSTIWPHVFRKAFRKTLYRANIADDLSEALMGHKLPASRGNYFDYNDDDQVAEQYVMADFGRTTSSRIARTEATLEALQKENADLKKQMDQIQESRGRTDAELNQLFQNPGVQEALKKALKEMKKA